MEMQQTQDSKTQSALKPRHESESSSSPEKSPAEEPQSRHQAAHLLLTSAGGGSSQPPPGKFSSLLTGPQLSHPANSSIRSQAVLQMQRDYGNSYVQRVLQAKLTIGRPGDKYEQEADHVAEQVMRMPEPQIQRKPEDEKKKKEEELVQPKPLASQITPVVQRQVNPEEEKKEEEEKVLRAKQASSTTPKVGPDFESRIEAMKGSGQPLTESTRSYFEPRFGHDFGNVRVHSDTVAAKATKALNAKAFTTGLDIAFGAEKYSPETETGKKLLAHELTHVVQQERQEVNRSNLSSQQPSLQRDVSGGATVVSPEKKKVYPPVNWTLDRVKRRNLYIPRSGVSLKDVALFLYGDPSAEAEIATVNGIDPAAPLVSGRPLQLTGKKLTPSAYANLNASPKIPMGETNPEAFLAKKKTLDAALEQDFRFIVDKLDEGHYSDSDEGQVISILRKWGKEKFAVTPHLYPWGGEYLDKLFSKLIRKSKDVGVVTTQWTNYYNLIFNHFDRVGEVKAIRDAYSRTFKGDSGSKELSFGSFFWKQVKEGKVRDQIFGYFKGLGKGLWSGAKGTVMMAYTLVTNPKKFFSDLKKLPAALKTLWEKRGDLWKKFANASSEEQAEMIGEVFGEIEFMIGSAAAGGAAAKGVQKLTQVPGTVGKIAKTTQAIAKIPKAAVGAVAKGVKTVVLKGVRFAAEGAIFAAKGIYKIGSKILRGTWSVVEKTVEKITRKIYYFYDEVAGKLQQIPAKFARECVRCTVCKLTEKGKIIVSKAARKAEDIAEAVLGKKSTLIKRSSEVIQRILSNGADLGLDIGKLRNIVQSARKAGAIQRTLGYIDELVKYRIPGSKSVLSDLAIGGNKAQGARFVLKYIDENKLWGAVKKIEDLAEEGGRRWDAIIRGFRYQFKDWGKFYTTTFVKQIKADLRLTGLERLKWVFRHRELGDAAKIRKLMETTLRNAAKEGKIGLDDAVKIIERLKDIVVVY